VLLRLCQELPPHSRILDVGCGNGSVAVEIARLGHSIVGVDLSQSGIGFARENCPAGRFEVLPANKDLPEALQEAPFDLVYSIEVVEHLYDPRTFIAGCFAATKSRGRFFCTTPYHGYLKNLALSVAGVWDRHGEALVDGGHIKFWSRRTLSTLILEGGFRDLRFRGAGRWPYLWKSMAIDCIRP
jgi:2-polyprenyl-3-methyl-5-hydroxy-6-metoxy-1,4-benzoquinol methylase